VAPALALGWVNEELESGSDEQKASLAGVTGTFELCNNIQDRSERRR
jgi:hypothetical protein